MYLGVRSYSPHIGLIITPEGVLNRPQVVYLEDAVAGIPIPLPATVTFVSGGVTGASSAQGERVDEITRCPRPVEGIDVQAGRPEVQHLARQIHRARQSDLVLLFR